MSTTIITDFDGVFTSPSFLYTKDGKVGKFFSPNDGQFFKYILENLEKLGVSDILILTGENKAKGMEVSLKRLEDLGIKDRLNFCPGKDKYDWIKSRYELNKVFYIGDDFYDMRIFKECYYSACPSNAILPLKRLAKYVSPYKGGEEAFSDICIHFIEKISNQKMEDLL